MNDKILLNTPLYTFCHQLDSANLSDLDLIKADAKQTWLRKISLLQTQLKTLPHLAGQVLLRLPMGANLEDIESIVLYRGIIFVIRIDMESDNYQPSSIAQVHLAARQLKDLNQANKDKYIIPVLLAAKAQPQSGSLAATEDRLFDTMCDSGEYLSAMIEHFANQFKADEIDAENWLVQHYRSL
ncbi:MULTISPECIES: hypothetical protein [Vibrio]|uniref:hypothetical protein n=1 Tax=Vibrio TaxID=662 RepID=UPI0020753C7E|nr:MULTISPECIES: hypothetical protein [Vibrio]USD33152.1 hypothetical protein J8Z27_03295 [Vibrio sp. SCSIO 43186]USD46221.1 hypothetical protein J4N38_03470 [Vibrio sp. SCSIO 43145]USD70276.1 hypothetical protein J4N41_03295 [Vibrio sp. SCSIO 43139]USD95188.1 hypothetical protein CTT30_03360 [Vibrio coralliilyticus]